MLRGLPASIVVHAAVMGASYLTWPYWGSSSRVYVAEFESVDVNFAEIGELTNIAPLIEAEPETDEAVATPPAEVIEEAPAEEDLPEAEEEVTNVDEAPPEALDPEDVLPDFEQPAPEEEPETQPEPEQKTPKNDLMDFLNQSETTFKSEIETRRERPEPEPAAPTETPQTALEDAPKPAETRTRQGAGERSGNIARIEAILYARILPCWDGVADLPFPDQLNVRMKVQLSPNGSVSDLGLIEPTRRPVGSSPMGTAVDRALRAVRKCAPYNLPQDEYDNWREGVVNLGPAFTPTNPR